MRNSTVLGGFREIGSIPWRVVGQQPQRPFRLPTPAVPFQDFASLRAGLGGASVRSGDDGWFVPPIELRLHCIENGRFLVGHGLDGAIVAPDGTLVRQTAVFRTRRDAGLEVETGPVHQLDEVFVGFDGAWRNYFHFLCFGLVKSIVAAGLLDRSVAIAMPDYAANAIDHGASFTAPTFDQAIAAGGLADRVLKLPPGCYQAKRVYTLWTMSDPPTDIMHLDAFAAAFELLATRLVANEAASDMALPAGRIYLARGAGVADRLDPPQAELVAATAHRHGFTRVSFEGMDLRTQAAIIARATHLLSPHGAGLTNLMFGRPELRVLELNRPLDQGPQLRPWFLLAARSRGLDYRMLDVADPWFSARRLDVALGRLVAV